MICVQRETQSRMKLFLSLLYIAALPHWEVHAAPQAVVQVLTGSHHVFSGEKVVLRCVVDQDFYLNMRWFWGTELLYEAQDLVLWQVEPDQSGSYYCQGLRKTPSTTLYTNISQPFLIHVDVGWAILEPPPPLLLVGDDLKVTCRIRGNHVPQQVILYRDGQEVLREGGPSAPAPILTSLTLQDSGSYHCRATWYSRGRSRAAESQPISITVREILDEPTLQVNENNPEFPPRKMQLVCQVEYHAHPPAPPLVYLFYLNDKIMRPATSESKIFVPILSGDYSCRTKVPLLNVERSSKSTTV